jgi:hypothetical protein
MKRIFSVNDEYVTAEVFANFIADLIHQGWTLAPPPPTTEKPVYEYAKVKP